jgi:hypothetical protein
MSVKDDLIAAKALIDTPEKWFPGWLNGVSPERFDVGQAVLVATAARDRPALFNALDALDSAVPDFDPEYRNALRRYVQWMDESKPDHADIMALFDRAINAAEAT